MNLSAIISKTLSILGIGTDPHTVETYAPKFTLFANEAVSKIADKVKEAKKETLELDSDKCFNIASLSRQVARILEVRASGKIINFDQDVYGNGIFRCDTEAERVDVIYRFIPQRIEGQSDVPETPEYTHYMIPNYIAACHYACSGDTNLQAAASVYFQLFNNDMGRIKPTHRAEPDSFRLKNF